MPIYQPHEYEREFGLEVEEPRAQPSAREPVRRTATGVIALAFAAAGIVVSVAGWGMLSSSEDLGAVGLGILLIFLGWISTGVGTVIGLVSCLVALPRRRPDGPSVIATVLGIATAVAWVLFLFRP